jgi:DNA-binding CsgD family transcriptional regulator
MSLTISSTDLGRLEPVLTALLSPLDHRSPEGWARAVMAATRTLLGADQAFLALPEQRFGGRDVRLWGSGPFTEEAARAYDRHFHRVDPGRDRALGLDVFRVDTLFDRSKYERTELFVDWCTPYRLLDPIGMSVRAGDGFSAVLAFYRDRAGDPRFSERGTALLRLLLPAFKAGVHASLHLAHQRALLARVLDDGGIGLALFDTAGHLVHQNPALSRMLSAEPEAERLRQALTSVGAAIAATVRPLRAHAIDVAPPPAREVRTARARYRLYGAHAGASFAGADTLLVLAARVLPEPLSDHALRARYRLTEREVEVAHLLDEGKRNAELAETLGISAHTSERHTEHVLMKLGVRSRAQVAAKLREP